MQILANITQGTDAWKKERANRFTASEAAAVFGQHKYMSREDLLRQKALQTEQEVSAAQQRIFDKGHEAEAAARPIAEEIIGEELFPVTGVANGDDRFLASMDGLTMLEDTGFEHKSINQELRGITSADELAEHYKHQMDHQMMVSDQTERILFVASDGTRDDFVSVWYERDEDRIKKLRAAWDQFEKDLAEYEPKEKEAKAEGATPETLPALRIQVTGEVTDSNLAEFRHHAETVIGSINTDLATDEEFATAEKTVKWCKDVEQRLDAAKDHALSQTATIDELLRTLDDIKEQARQARLNLDKQVKAKKEAKRDEIYQGALNQIRAHYQSLNESLGSEMLGVPANAGSDIAAALKGKKNISSLQSAADEAVANAKLAANELAEKVRGNLKQLDEHAPDHRFLFNDLDRIATKEPEDFAALVKTRISDYEQAEKEHREREARQAEAAKQTQAAPSEQEQVAVAQSESEALYGKSEPFQPGNLGEDLRDDDFRHLSQIIGQEALDDLRFDEDGNEYELTIEVRRKSLKRQDEAA